MILLLSTGIVRSIAFFPCMSMHDLIAPFANSNEALPNLHDLEPVTRDKERGKQSILCFSLLAKIEGQIDP